MPMPVSLTSKRIDPPWSARRRLALPGVNRAVMGELHRVAAQVEQDLLEPQRVAASHGGEAPAAPRPPVHRRFRRPAKPGCRRYPATAPPTRKIWLPVPPLPASIFARSRMSLMILITVGRRVDLQQILPQLPLRSQVQGQIQKTQHGGHGRADLVAHAGQK